MKKKKFQPALKSTDLIEVLNKPFIGRHKYEYILNFERLAKWLSNKGYKTEESFYGQLDAEGLEENTGAFYDEFFFESYFASSPKELILGGDTIIDLILRTLNVKYYLCVSWVMPVDENYEEFFVECENDENMIKVVVRWCEAWQLSYKKEATGIHIYDELQSDETDMVFIFLNYTDLDGNQKFTWAMHDLMAGDIQINNEELFDEIGELDINNIFYDKGSIKCIDSITRVFSNIIVSITDTKEVVF